MPLPSLLFVGDVQPVREFHGEIGFGVFAIQKCDLMPEKKDGTDFVK